MQTSYTTRVEKALDLSLTVDHASMTVDSYQPDSGDSYRLIFSRTEADEDIAERIGYEILSWLKDMEDEFDENGKENRA